MLTPIADGSAATTMSRAAAIDPPSIKLAIHKTAPAVAGTDMLSSSRTGIVSTSAAATAATIGATMVKASGGSGEIAGRTHEANATAAALPKTMNAVVPATVLSGFHGRRTPVNAEP